METDKPAPEPYEFSGAAYDRDSDQERLTTQMLRIWRVMKDGNWRTLAEIEAITGDPPASISAQLRHFRKKRFGQHIVNRRARGDRARGLYEYQLVVMLRTQGILEFFKPQV